MISRVEKIGGASSRGENSYGLETVCKVNVIVRMQFYLVWKVFCSLEPVSKVSNGFHTRNAILVIKR